MTRTLVLSASELAEVRRILRAHLPSEVRVDAFGSRAKGTPKPWSDLDLALEADAPLPLALLARLSEAFDESALPFKVDLVNRRNVSDGFATIIAADCLPLTLSETD